MNNLIPQLGQQLVIKKLHISKYKYALNAILNCSRPLPQVSLQPNPLPFSNSTSTVSLVLLEGPVLGALSPAVILRGDTVGVRRGIHRLRFNSISAMLCL